MSSYARALHAVRRQLGRAALVAGTATALLVASNPTGAFAATNPTARPAGSPATQTAGTAWTFRSVDNMHVTRDFPCWPQPASFMAAVAADERALNANYAGIATPYDAPANYHQCTPKDPIAFERAWVQALRTQGLHIWFRQTWFNWEGSYGAPKLTATTFPAIRPGTAAAVLNGTDTTSYLARTYYFILRHRDLYANGDVFTPEAEPQNGGVKLSYGQCGSSLCQFSDWPQLNQWLRDSMTVDAAAFRQLGLQVKVGYWGLPCSNYKWNGADNIEASTISQMGVFVTDCYFHDVQTVVSSVQLIHDTYNTPVIVGEWGDIWDDNVQPGTSQEIGSLLTAMHGLPYVTGLNYWQAYGGGGGEGLIDPTTMQLNTSGLAVRSGLY
jgi:hypothetical protein